jgi:hypothetical protein
LWTNSSVVATFASNGNTTLAGALSVSSTTASTSTSSGALVVGNGTSGGLGVGGNAYIGGDLVLSTGGKAIYSQGYVTVKDLQVNLLSRGTNNGWTTGLHFYSSNTDYSATLLHNPGNGELQIYTNATSSNYTASDIALLINTSKQVQVKATTASTSTSSGALVVSGGVGVAGNTNIGGALRFHTNTALPGTASISKDATFGLNFYASTGSTYDFTIFNAAGTGLLVNPTGTSALTAFDTFTATGTLIANAASNAFRITTAQTPASAGATGTAGTIAWDTSYIYVCTATNTWKRVAISTW